MPLSFRLRCLIVADPSDLIIFYATDTFGVRNVAPPSLVELEAKKSIEDLTEKDLKGKKVLVRCDGECGAVALLQHCSLAFHFCWEIDC